jgi:RNA-directed DNA polymerase
MPMTSWSDFQRVSDANRFGRDLRERVRRFALELHPTKTRLFRFGKFAAANRRNGGEGKPATFDFLGFTHICGKSRAGKFVLVRRTMRTRMRATLQRLNGELQRRRHRAIPTQGRWLASVVRGYFAYHAIPTNIARLGEFRTQVVRLWHRALRRRSPHDRTTWDRMRVLAARWLPHPRVLHPWPEERFDVRTRGKSPVQ